GSLVEINLAALPRLGFGEADRAHFRLGKDRRRDDRMIDLHILAAIDGVGKGMALADRHGGEVRAVRHIAYGIDAVYRGLRIFIDDHLTGLAELHTCFFKAKPPGERYAARRIHHGIGFQNLAACQRQFQLAILFDDRGDVAVHAQAYTLLHHLFGEHFAQIIVEAAHEKGTAIKLLRLHAKPVENACELHRDIATADHDNALRQFLKMEG